jgi:hypothetical protein
MPLTDINPTTRCYPRSRRDAFKFDYMSGIEYYKRPSHNKSVVVFWLFIAIIMVFATVKAI